jgi:glucosamine--fructose-6-phosphate aminotransferase (isomerizing)
MNGELMASEIEEIPKVFQRLLNDTETFENVGTLLRERDITSILILARGTSDNAAHFLKYLIETQLGLPVGLTSPSSVTIYKTELKFKNVLVIALSQSGQSPDLVEYATAALSSGATLISLTNDPTSPLAQAAHLHVNLLAGPELAVAASKSYAAELLASYLLVCAWQNISPDAEEIISEAQKVLHEDIDHVIASCSLKREIVILGRGFSYPNAREAALKIQETCKVSVQGLSTADYLHGPISALTSQTQVLILAPIKIPEFSMKEATDRIRSSGAQIFWLGLGGKDCPGDFRVAGAQVKNEILASIVDAIVLQRFALKLCIQNNLDPDSPVGLSKVTLTH